MTARYFQVLVVSAVAVIFLLPTHNCVPVSQHYSTIDNEYAAPSAPIVASAEYYVDPNQYYAQVAAQALVSAVGQYYSQPVQSYASLLPLSSYYYPQRPSYAEVQPTIPPGQYYPEISELPPVQYFPSLSQYYATPPPERVKVVNIFA
uniref:Uncharacterized protein n=1 Tax=Glossina austeni TaxID=7395 RepID=A0A1A9VGN5_GLOAU